MLTIMVRRWTHSHPEASVFAAAVLPPRRVEVGLESSKDNSERDALGLKAGFGFKG